MNSLVKTILIALTLTTSWLNTAKAAWFEASGQAIIHNGNKELARQQATHEAIRQALLFAGASVRSVQNMVDGLLNDDRFEIRATGEVASVELIDEIYQNDLVTITIRADIFPQENICSASDYRKNIATTYFSIKNRHHASVGNLHNIAKPISKMIFDEFGTYSKFSYISNVEPYTFVPHPDEMAMQAMHLAEKNGAQFVLLGNIVELSVEKSDKDYMDYVTFWESKQPLRNFGLEISLVDGSTGDVLLQHSFNTAGTWQFDLHEDIDPNSKRLWKSSFGQSIKKVVEELALKVDDTISCLPSYGRVLEVRNNQIATNIGSLQGVQRGDELQVFQMRQFYTPSGMPHYQYDIHPAKMIVANVYPNSAILRTTDGTPMLNIQPNDFVVRR